MSDGALAAIIGSRHGAVDDRDGRASLGITRVEKAAFDQADSHGFEESIAGALPVVDVVAGAVGDGREVFDLGVVGIDGTLRRKSAHGGSGLDARDQGNLLLHRLPEPEVRGCIGVGGCGEIHAQREEAAGLKSGIHLAQFPERADHETSADQQNQGERELARDQDGAETVGRDRSAGASAGGFQRVVQRSGGDLGERRESEEKRSE